MAIAGENAGHVRSVSVSVIGPGIARHKAFTVDNARPCVVGLFQIVVKVDATIDHGDANARSIQTVLLPGKIVHHSWYTVIPRSFGATVRAYIGNIGVLFQPCQQSSGNAV